PQWARRGLAAVVRSLPRFGDPSLGDLWHRLERVVESSLTPPFADYTRKVAIFTSEQHRQLFSPDFQRRTSAFSHLEAFWAVRRDNPGADPIAQACLADLSVYLPGDMLAKVDRMSMACSLEVRVPLLDHTLVEFAQSVPIHLKMRGVQGKYLLRRAVTPWLPPAILRRPKRGFNPPLEFWLRGNLMEYAAEHHMLETLAESGYFNLRYVRELADAHTRGRRNYARQLWALLVFAVWWRRVRGHGRGPL